MISYTQPIFNRFKGYLRFLNEHPEFYLVSIIYSFLPNFLKGETFREAFSALTPLIPLILAYGLAKYIFILKGEKALKCILCFAVCFYIFSYIYIIAIKTLNEIKNDYINSYILNILVDKTTNCISYLILLVYIILPSLPVLGLFWNMYKTARTTHKEKK
nr:hypothetical protein [uncultured Aggregatibacter sp.]